MMGTFTFHKMTLHTNGVIESKKYFYKKQHSEGRNKRHISKMSSNKSLIKFKNEHLACIDDCRMFYSKQNVYCLSQK